MVDSVARGALMAYCIDLPHYRLLSATAVVSTQPIRKSDDKLTGFPQAKA